MIIGSIALLTAAFFTGAAAYISIVEHPVRFTLAPEARLNQWRRSYDRAAPLQASLAVISGLAGLWTWWSNGNLCWLIGALLILANWPFTFIVIFPINNQLKKLSVSEDSLPLIRRWGLLHAGRTVLGLAATFAFVGQFT